MRPIFLIKSKYDILSLPEPKQLHLIFILRIITIASAKVNNSNIAIENKNPIVNNASWRTMKSTTKNSDTIIKIELSLLNLLGIILNFEIVDSKSLINKSLLIEEIVKIIPIVKRQDSSKYNENSIIWFITTIPANMSPKSLLESL
jgi:hypothetical protein